MQRKLYSLDPTDDVKTAMVYTIYTAAASEGYTMYTQDVYPSLATKLSTLYIQVVCPSLVTKPSILYIQVVYPSLATKPNILYIQVVYPSLVTKPSALYTHAWRGFFRRQSSVKARINLLCIQSPCSERKTTTACFAQWPIKGN